MSGPGFAAKRIRTAHSPGVGTGRAVQAGLCAAQQEQPTNSKLKAGFKNIDSLLLRCRRLNILEKEHEGENQASEKDLTHGASCELSTIKQHALPFPFKVCLNGSVSLCSSLPVSLSPQQARTKSRPVFSGVLIPRTYLTGEAGITSKLLGGLKKLLFSVGIVCYTVLGVVSKL